MTYKANLKGGYEARDPPNMRPPQYVRLNSGITFSKEPPVLRHEYLVDGLQPWEFFPGPDIPCLKSKPRLTLWQRLITWDWRA